MYRDKRILYAVSGILPLVLLALVFLPTVAAGFATAAALLVAAVVAHLLLKKRSIPSVYRRQVLGLMAVIAPAALMVYYLTGIRFGFHRSLLPTGLAAWNRMLPIALAVLATEYLRTVILAQESRAATVLMHFSGVLSEVALLAGLSTVYHFNSFMDAVGLVFFPALASNLLYHYLSARYGMWPVVVYRGVMLLYPYLIPYEPAVPDALVAFAKMLLPLFVYWFIGGLYEKKQRRALQRGGKWQYAVTAVAVVIAALYLALISCQFRFGVLVIATDSMTGELNKGDAVLFERYEDQTLEVQQIIVYEKDDVRIVHRVVDVKHINGETRYTTKGDANNAQDAGYVTNADIVGVATGKLPYVGYPTLWLRELVANSLRGD